MPASEHPSRTCGFYWTEGTPGLGWGRDCVPTLGRLQRGCALPAGCFASGGRGRRGSTSQGQFRLIALDIRDAERLQSFPNWSSEAVTLDGDKFRERRRWLLVGNAVNVRAAAAAKGSLRPGLGRVNTGGGSFRERPGRWRLSEMRLLALRLRWVHGQLPCHVNRWPSSCLIEGSPFRPCDERLP